MKEYLERIEEELEEKKNEVLTIAKNKNFYMNKANELEEENEKLHRELEEIEIERDQMKLNINNISGVSGKDDFEDDILELN